MGFPGGSDSKASAYNVGGLGSIPGSGRSPGEGNGSTLQYLCLENPMDRGAWSATVYWVAKSRTRLSDFTSDAKLINVFQGNNLWNFLFFGSEIFCFSTGSYYPSVMINSIQSLQTNIQILYLVSEQVNSQSLSH